MAFYLSVRYTINDNGDKRYVNAQMSAILMLAARNANCTSLQTNVSETRAMLQSMITNCTNAIQQLINVDEPIIDQANQTVKLYDSYNQSMINTGVQCDTGVNALASTFEQIDYNASNTIQIQAGRCPSTSTRYLYKRIILNGVYIDYWLLSSDLPYSLPNTTNLVQLNDCNPSIFVSHNQTHKPAVSQQGVLNGTVVSVTVGQGQATLEMTNSSIALQLESFVMFWSMF